MGQRSVGIALCFQWNDKTNLGVLYVSTSIACDVDDLEMMLMLMMTIRWDDVDVDVDVDDDNKMGWCWCWWCHWDECILRMYMGV